MPGKGQVMVRRQSKVHSRTLENHCGFACKRHSTHLGSDSTPNHPPSRHARPEEHPGACAVARAPPQGRELLVSCSLTWVGQSAAEADAPAFLMHWHQPRMSRCCLWVACWVQGLLLGVPAAAECCWACPRSCWASPSAGPWASHSAGSLQAESACLRAYLQSWHMCGSGRRLLQGLVNERFTRLTAAPGASHAPA